MAYGAILGQTPKQIKNPTTIATNVSYNNSQTSSIITGNNVQEAIDELFTSVSNGKELVANAITDKGVATSVSDTFATMAENIGNINVGVDLSSIQSTRTIPTSGQNIEFVSGMIGIFGYVDFNHLYTVKIIFCDTFEILTIGCVSGGSLDNIQLQNYQNNLTSVTIITGNYLNVGHITANFATQAFTIGGSQYGLNIGARICTKHNT